MGSQGAVGVKIEQIIEIGRAAHELVSRHGWNAANYAAKLAEEALANGLTDDYEFWEAVESWLKARD
jgi:hypothetical protein